MYLNDLNEFSTNKFNVLFILNSDKIYITQLNIENDIKTNYIWFNAEDNILNDNNKNRIIHSYKNSLNFIKQEKYIIFERKAAINKYNIDYLSESIENLKN